MKRPFLKLSGGFWGLIISATMAICALTVTGFLGGVGWIFDLTVNFRVQYLASLVLATLLFLAGQKWLWAVVAGVFAIVNFLDILPSCMGADRRTAASANPIRLLLANVLSSNRQHDKVANLIRSVDPDVVVVIEATSFLMKELSRLEGRYPYVVSQPREDNYGIAVLSRFPFRKSEVLDIGDVRVPSVVARLRIGDRDLTLVAIHTHPPVRKARAGYRNRQLEAAARYVRSVKGPVILLGDLNTTPWSPHFKRLIRRAGLRDSRRGRGIQPTWPAQTPLPLLRIPLDHVLCSPGISVLRRKIGPGISSDHLPVIVDLSLAEFGEGT